MAGLDPELQVIMARKWAVKYAKEARSAIAARDANIAALRLRGVPLREVAELVGLSHTAISKIAERTDICPECLMPGGETSTSWKHHVETCSTQQH